MNEVLLELNSYTQKARVFLNGSEPSEYSELKNYKYKQIVEKPGMLLGAISRELNDEFSLAVIAPDCIYCKIVAVAQADDYCRNCQKVSPKLNMTTQERLTQLGQHITQSAFAVLLTGVSTAPESLNYGAVDVSFTTDEDAEADFQINFLVGQTAPPSGKGYVNVPVEESNSITAEFIADVVEAYFLNPFIGKTVESVQPGRPDVEACCRLTPIVSATCHDNMVVGTETLLYLQVYPQDSAAPDIVIQSSNADVLRPALGASQPDAWTLFPLSAGEAELKVFVKGESEPFFVKKVFVKKVVCVSSLEILDFDEVLCPGHAVKINVNAFPSDAADANNVQFMSSAEGIAEIVDGKLVPKKAGEFTLTARTAQAETKRTFVVYPNLESIQLSEHDVSINVGGKRSVTVALMPADAHNADYRWTSTDKTVAVVINENGSEYIKAVGIGTCTLACSAADGSVKDRCKVTVNSALYQKKNTASYKKPAIIIIAIVLLLALIGRVNKFMDRMESERLYKNAISVDVFEGIKYSFSGLNGSGTVSINVPTSTNPFVQGCKFFASPSSGLSNGDKVTITVYFSDSSVELYGYAPSKKEMTVVVSGLAPSYSYIENYKGVPANFVEEAKATQVDWCLNKMKAMATNPNQTKSSAKCYGVYYQDARYSSSEYNTLVIVVGGKNVDTQTGEVEEYFAARTYVKVAIDENGKMINQHSDATGSLSDTYKSSADVVNALCADEDYITVEIK